MQLDSPRMALAQVNHPQGNQCPNKITLNKSTSNNHICTVVLVERISKSKLKLCKHSTSKPKWKSCKHYLSIRVKIIRDQPFGNGGGWIYRWGEGVRISPRIGEGPHLKEGDNRDMIKGEYWESLLFWKPLDHEASAPLWESLNFRVQCKYQSKSCAGSASLIRCNLPSTWEGSVIVAQTQKLGFWLLSSFFLEKAQGKFSLVH